jgi:hypothetical protein
MGSETSQAPVSEPPPTSSVVPVALPRTVPMMEATAAPLAPRPMAETAQQSWPPSTEPAASPSGGPVRVVPTAARVATSPSARDTGTTPERAAADAKNLAAWGDPAAPGVDPRRFTEAHWQGLEVIPNSPLVAQALRLPTDVAGVIVDDVTLPADLQGFQAGDLVTHLGATATPDLNAFIQAADVLRDATQANVTILREGLLHFLPLNALGQRLGSANGETPSMIPPGARMPHPYRGPCTNCHRIGTTGTLAVDQGDMLTTAAPSIRAGAVRPHRDRGPCATCHQILP